jgi:hypothetical protein
MIDCADISCCRFEECAYDTTNSETGSEIVEEKPPKKSVPWYVWWFCFCSSHVYLSGNLFRECSTVALPHGALQPVRWRSCSRDRRGGRASQFIRVRLSLSHPCRPFAFTLATPRAATSPVLHKLQICTSENSVYIFFEMGKAPASASIDAHNHLLKHYEKFKVYSSQIWLGDTKSTVEFFRTVCVLVYIWSSMLFNNFSVCMA